MKMLRIIIDDKAIKNEIEGKETEVFNFIEKLNKEEKEFETYTTLSALLRGIYLADSEYSINRLQSILVQTKIMPELVNFKDKEQVLFDLTNLAQALGGNKNVKNF